MLGMRQHRHGFNQHTPHLPTYYTPHLLVVGVAFAFGGLFLTADLGKVFPCFDAFQVSGVVPQVHRLCGAHHTV